MIDEKEDIKENEGVIKHEKKMNDVFEESIKKVRKSPWIFVSIILLVLLVVSLAYPGLITGKVVSKDKAGNLMVEFLNEKTGGGVSLIDVEKQGGLYEVLVSYQGQEIPVYMTIDADYFVQAPEEILLTGSAVSDTTSTQTNVPKSNVPIVELFIWSYCPYGVQAQGPVAEVANLLKDKVEFNAYLYYDGHGEYENQQNKIQACIQELDKDKYWKYAAGFVEDIYPKCGSSRDIMCDETESIKLMKSLGIDSNKIMQCVESQGESLYAEHSSYAQGYRVQGSPTIIINGAQVSVARNAESIKTAVCQAFTDAPAECSEVLDSSDATADGNC